MKSKVNKSVETPSISEFWTVADVKRYLRISQSAAYALTHNKGFPVSRFGSSIRIPKEPFLAWVASNTVIPAGVAEYLGMAS